MGALIALRLMYRERWVILDKDPERRFNSEWASPLAPMVELEDTPDSGSGGCDGVAGSNPAWSIDIDVAQSG